MSNGLYAEFLFVLTSTFIVGSSGVFLREFFDNPWFRNLGRVIALGAFATWAMFGWHAVEENSQLQMQLRQARLGKPVMQHQQTSVVSDIHLQRDGITIDWRRNRPFDEAVFVEREF